MHLRHVTEGIELIAIQLRAQRLAAELVASAYALFCCKTSCSIVLVIEGVLVIEMRSRLSRGAASDNLLNTCWASKSRKLKTLPG